MPRCSSGDRPFSARSVNGSLRSNGRIIPRSIDWRSSRYCACGNGQLTMRPRDSYCVPTRFAAGPSSCAPTARPAARLPIRCGTESTTQCVGPFTSCVIGVPSQRVALAPSRGTLPVRRCRLADRRSNASSGKNVQDQAMTSRLCCRRMARFLVICLRLGRQTASDNWRCWNYDFSGIASPSPLGGRTPEEVWDGVNVPEPTPIRATDPDQIVMHVQRQSYRRDRALPIIAIRVERKEAA